MTSSKKAKEAYAEQLVASDGNIEQVGRQIFVENDRAAAIIAGAHIDWSLSEAIKSRLVHNRLADEILDFEGTLGSFGSKLKVGFLLGLYTKFIHDDLKLFASIRNDFAHKIDVISFKNSIVLPKIMSLKLPTTNILVSGPEGQPPAPNYYYVKYTIPEFLEEDLSPKHRFVFTFYALRTWLFHMRRFPQRPQMSVDADSPPHLAKPA